MCVCSWPEKAMTGSWELINFMSTFINNNIGLIQIIIALVALWLAKKGYDQLILQIEMAQNQFIESEKQTKHFADQVKEAARQTMFAARQFENSNKQIDTLIEHRDLVLEIRNSELKSEYAKMTVKTIEKLQETVEFLIDSKISLKDKKQILGNQYLERKLAANYEKKINDEIEELKSKITQLILITGDLATNKISLDNKTMQDNILTLNLMYIRALRVAYPYQKLNDSNGQ